MPALVLKLLGGFEASVEGGAAIPLASKTGQALVAFLALTPDRRHSRDKLATLLWEDRPDEQARTSLRQTLAVLRRALPTECLRAEADWIALAPDACRIDVAEFERLAARNDAASLEHAASLYRGAFLDGFHLRSDGFAGWLRGERGTDPIRVDIEPLPKGDADTILTVTTHDVTATQTPRAVDMTPASAPPFAVAAAKESDADAIAAELRALSPDRALLSALRALRN